jgi:hypothetical protein
MHYELMARVYYPKKTSTKLLEGATAGLLGGAAVFVVMVLADLLTPNRSWWTSAGVVGSLFTGVTNLNTRVPDMSPFLIGVLLTIAGFALFGIGLVYYMPLFRRFNINPILGGAIYGLILWVAIDLLILNPITGGRLNLVTLLVADLIAGAAMGWWLSRPQDTRSTPEATV